MYCTNYYIIFYIQIRKKGHNIIKTYVFDIKNLYAQLGPKLIITDFEKGIMNAAKYVFSSVDIIKSGFFLLISKYLLSNIYITVEILE